MLERGIYFFLFYLAWGLCLIGVKKGQPWIGPMLVLLLALVHFERVKWRKEELYIALLLTLFGTLYDTALLNLGIVTYFGGYESFPRIAPLWVSSIWLLFSVSLTNSFGWLRNRWKLSAIFGATGGVLSYVAAVRAGAALFPNPALAVLVLALSWAVLMPLILLLSKER